MQNHSHPVIGTPQPTLVAGVKWLRGTCPGRFRRRPDLAPLGLPALFVGFVATLLSEAIAAVLLK